MAPARQQLPVSFSAAEMLCCAARMMAEAELRRTPTRTLGATKAQSGGSGVAGVGVGVGGATATWKTDWPLLLLLLLVPFPSLPVYILALQYFRSGVICRFERDALIQGLASS